MFDVSNSILVTSDDLYICMLISITVIEFQGHIGIRNGKLKVFLFGWLVFSRAGVAEFFSLFNNYFTYRIQSKFECYLETNKVARIKKKELV